MKPKLTDEEKKELMQMCIAKIKRCNYLLDEAYKNHCLATNIASGVSANDEQQ